MNIPEMALACYHIFRAGGLANGGFNFDAKLRRQSIDPDDLLEAHVASMDACARGLLIAEKMIKDGTLSEFVEDRYAGWGGKEGKAILAGKRSLDDLSDYALRKKLDPQPRSGKQEHLERLLNEYL
jgi:xylose isomerase